MHSIEQKEIDIRRAQSMIDYLFLRTLRNRVRQSMTNNTASINYIQQLCFYLRKPANVDIYIACVGSKRVGYLLLRGAGSTTLITEAVDAPYRGSGIATRMVRHAQQLCADLTAEISAGNTASIKLHKATGFKFVSARGNVQTYRFTR